MKIGAIVYSETGNSLSVVLAFKQANEVRHEIDILPISTDETKTEISKLPALEKYDRLLVAGPVQAFSLCVPLQKAIKQIGDFRQVKVDIVLTQYFKWAALGGTRAVRQAQHEIMAHNGIIDKTAIIHWSSRHRQEQINDAIRLLSEF